MSDWIRLDTTKLNEPHPQNVGGVLVHVRLSPHDVPLFVRGKADPATGNFVIEFRYIDDEPWRVKAASEKGVSLRIGKRSGRLYGFEIARSLCEPHRAVNLLITQAVEHEIEGADRQSNQGRSAAGNYRAVEAAIAAARDFIFPPVAAG